MSLFVMMYSSDFFDHSDEGCGRDTAIGSSLSQIGWVGHIAIWKKRFEQRSYSRFSLYELDTTNATVIVHMDLRHPLKEKIVVNKPALEARISRSKSRLASLKAPMTADFSSLFAPAGLAGANGTSAGSTTTQTIGEILQESVVTTSMDQW
jgi:hypothetical protein